MNDVTVRTVNADELFNFLAKEDTAYIVTGHVGDLPIWISGYNQQLKKAHIQPQKDWITFNGVVFNSAFGLKDFTFSPKHNFLGFVLENSSDKINSMRLVMFKLFMQNGWLEDKVTIKIPILSKNRFSDMIVCVWYAPDNSNKKERFCISSDSSLSKGVDLSPYQHKIKAMAEVLIDD